MTAPTTIATAAFASWWRSSTIWFACHWSPRISSGKRISAVSIAVERVRPAGRRIEAAAQAAAITKPAPESGVIHEVIQRKGTKSFSTTNIKRLMDSTKDLDKGEKAKTVKKNNPGRKTSQP